MGKPKKKLSAYNLYMKRTLKGKMKGKTKAQRLAIFKAAARGWKKGKPRTVSRSSKPKSRASPKKRSKPTGGTTRMTKNSFNMNKIYSLANKAAFFAPYVAIAMDESLDPGSKVNRGIAWLTGYDMAGGEWRFEYLEQGWKPYVVTKIVTAIVPRLTRFAKGLLG